VEDRRRFKVLIITVTIVHIVVRMMLSKGLAVISHDGKNGSLQLPRAFQMIINALDHVIQKVQIVVA